VQFLVLSRISGRRRTRVMVVMGVVWATAWLVVGAAGLVPGSALAALGMLAFMGVFAFGETLMQPTIPAIANDLASDHTRGRYNAINAGAFQGGAITGPVVAGQLLDHDLAAVYIGLMVVGCLAICVMAGALERRIPARANGVAEETPARAAAEAG
jgi:MFS family permease